MILDVDTVSGCEAHTFANALKNMSNQAGGGCFAVGAGDRNDGDAGFAAGREEHFNDVLGNVAGNAFAGVKVHPKARGGVNFDDCTAVFADRYGDVGTNEIDSGNIKADDAGSPFGNKDVVGMNNIGAINSGAASTEVGGRFEAADLAGGQDGIKGMVLQSKKGFGHRIHFDQRQNILVTIAPAGVGVECVDQLLNGFAAITDNLGRDALGNGTDFVVDDKNTVVIAIDILFDEDGVGIGLGRFEGDKGGISIADVNGDTFAVVGIEGLDDNGIAANIFDGVEKFVFVIDAVAFGYRNAHVA